MNETNLLTLQRNPLHSNKAEFDVKKSQIRLTSKVDKNLDIMLTLEGIVSKKDANGVYTKKSKWSLTNLLNNDKFALHELAQGHRHTIFEDHDISIIQKKMTDFSSFIDITAPSDVTIVRMDAKHLQGDKDA